VTNLTLGYDNYKNGIMFTALQDATVTYIYKDSKVTPTPLGGEVRVRILDVNLSTPPVFTSTINKDVAFIGDSAYVNFTIQAGVTYAIVTYGNGGIASEYYVSEEHAQSLPNTSIINFTGGIVLYDGSYFVTYTEGRNILGFETTSTTTNGLISKNFTNLSNGVYYFNVTS